VTVTEVDGVPTLFAPTRGPLVAGLMFRVGRADETLASAGITHLVEHLALHRQGLPDHHANASVGTTITHFHTSGPPQAVVTFFRSLSEALHDLPADRLPVEKDILRAEAAGRARGNLPLWRYGAQGYGLVSLPELGLARLTVADLTAWAQTWFTRENAVAWIAGEQLPTDLRLPLPSGVRRPVPAASSALPVTPAYVHGNLNGVVMDAVVPRGTAAGIYAALLERALFRDLRQDAGLSYAVNTDYTARGDDQATITAFVDALPEKNGAVVGAFIDTLNFIRRSGFTQEDLDAVRVQILRDLSHPEVEAARIPGRATSRLTGHPDSTTAALIDEVTSVTLADVHEVAKAVHQSALVQVPYGHRVAVSGFQPGPVHSDAAVPGTRFASQGTDQSSLVLGNTGVSLVAEDGHAVTVRFSECVARLDWPDGAATFIGQDGMNVAVEPTLYRVDGPSLAALAAVVPDSIRIPMPARSADQIPQPSRTKPTRFRGRHATARRVELAVMLVLAAALFWVFVDQANAWKPADGPVTEKLILGLMVAGSAAFLRAFFIAVRRVRTGTW
jgi:zinc protease